jgi:hypothetical protein
MEFKQKRKGRVQTSLHLDFDSSHDIAVGLKAILSDSDFPMRDLNFRGRILRGDISGLISTNVAQIGEQVQSMVLKDCNLSWFAASRNADLNCPREAIDVIFFGGRYLQSKRLLLVHPELNLRLGRVRLGAAPSAEVRGDFSVDHGFLAGGKSQGRLIHADGRFFGTIRAEESNWDWQTQGDVSVSLPQFQRLVDILRPTPFSVPAPVHVLNGPMSMRILFLAGPGRATLRYDAMTRLDSRTQAAHLSMNGRTELIREVDGIQPVSEITLNIQKLILATPRVDLSDQVIGDIPQLRPDPRFSPLEPERVPNKIGQLDKMQKNTEAVSQVQAILETPLKPMIFRLRIRTEHGSPREKGAGLRILTNLSPQPISVSLDVKYEEVGSDSNVLGWIRLERTPLDLFHKKSALEEFRVELLPNDEQRLFGRLSIEVPDYSIQVLLVGTGADPQLRFTSSPPLDESQILAVLFFGRPLQQLDEEQRNSVSSLNAAFADAVLGFSSLYLLAKTPVETISYNPENRMVSATLSLGGGATLEIGRGVEDTTGFGFRKRLSREFVFRSDVERIGATGKRTVSALIEWIRRF